MSGTNGRNQFQPISAVCLLGVYKYSTISSYTNRFSSAIVQTSVETGLCQFERISAELGVLTRDESSESSLLLCSPANTILTIGLPSAV